MSMLDLIPGVAAGKSAFGAIIGGGALVGLLLVSWYIHSLRNDVENLQKENSTLVSNNKILQVNVETITRNADKYALANAANSKTVNSLLQERQSSIKVINDMALTAANDKKALADLSAKIDTMVSDPKNDGQVAVVLREVVRDIQNTRR